MAVRTAPVDDGPMLYPLIGAVAIGLSLGLLGSGGSILTVPVLHYLAGQPERVAIAGSLVVVGLISTAAVVPYAMHRQVDWRNVLRFGLPGMAGAWLGASLARYVPGTVQLASFAVVMSIAAWRMLAGKPVSTQVASSGAVAVIAGGAGVGFLSGLVGVGGGFLIVPALVLLAGVPMIDAVGTSLAVIALNSFTGFARYGGVLASEGLSLDWRVLLAVSLVGIVGSLVGRRIGQRLPQARLRRLFGWFLVAMAVVIAIDVTPRLLA